MHLIDTMQCNPKIDINHQSSIIIHQSTCIILNPITSQSTHQNFPNECAPNDSRFFEKLSQVGLPINPLLPPPN